MKLTLQKIINTNLDDFLSICSRVMIVTYTLLVILGLVSRFKCEDGENSTEVEDRDISLGSKGLYGGWYYNSNASNPDKIHYIHGTHQAPRTNYYTSQNFYLDEGPNDTFDYYLGFGLEKMSDENFEYEDFHYYYHDINRTISENETVRSDFVIACHPNATLLCPENTETICLLNGTIYCMSKIAVLVPCAKENASCVNSVVPCVRSCIDLVGDFEPVSLPCLGFVVIVDVYEEKGKTLSKVGGTFVIMDALEEKERTFCVTVIVDPKPKPTD